MSEPQPNTGGNADAEPAEPDADAAGPGVHLDLGDRTPSDDVSVESALAELDEAQGKDLQAHIDAAESVQAALQRRLSDTPE